MHTLSFSNPDPRESGVLEAARAGNVTALRVFADKLRDRDQFNEAEKIALLCGEFEIRALQTQHLRRILATTPNQPDQFERYPHLVQVKEFATRFGLPIEAGQISKSKLFRSAFFILMPTDGREVEETAKRLGEFLESAFKGSSFYISAKNLPVTDAGREIEELITKYESQGEEGLKHAA